MLTTTVSILYDLRNSLKFFSRPADMSNRLNYPKLCSIPPCLKTLCDRYNRINQSSQAARFQSIDSDPLILHDTKVHTPPSACANRGARAVRVVAAEGAASGDGKAGHRA